MSQSPIIKSNFQFLKFIPHITQKWFIKRQGFGVSKSTGRIITFNGYVFLPIKKY